jgi:hypothetical protein
MRAGQGLCELLLLIKYRVMLGAETLLGYQDFGKMENKTTHITISDTNHMVNISVDINAINSHLKLNTVSTC